MHMRTLLASAFALSAFASQAEVALRCSQTPRPIPTCQNSPKEPGTFLDLSCQFGTMRLQRDATCYSFAAQASIEAAINRNARLTTGQPPIMLSSYDANLRALKIMIDDPKWIPYFQKRVKARKINPDGNFWGFGWQQILTETLLKSGYVGILKKGDEAEMAEDEERSLKLNEALGFFQDSKSRSDEKLDLLDRAELERISRTMKREYPRALLAGLRHRELLTAEQFEKSAANAAHEDFLAHRRAERVSHAFMSDNFALAKRELTKRFRLSGEKLQRKLGELSGAGTLDSTLEAQCQESPCSDAYKEFFPWISAYATNLDEHFKSSLRSSVTSSRSRCDATSRQTQERIVASLCRGLPVVASIPMLGLEMVNPETNEWTLLSGANHGGHAVTITGIRSFKDPKSGRERNYFMMRNSWGKDSLSRIPMDESCLLTTASVVENLKGD